MSDAPVDVMTAPPAKALRDAFEGLKRETGKPFNAFYDKIVVREWWTQWMNEREPIAPDKLQKLCARIERLVSEHIARCLKEIRSDLERSGISPEKLHAVALAEIRPRFEALQAVASFLEFDVHEYRLVVNPSRLIDLHRPTLERALAQPRAYSYERPRDEPAVRVLSASAEYVVIVVSRDELRRHAKGLVQLIVNLLMGVLARAMSASVRQPRLVAVKPDGCTEIVLEVSPEQARQLRTAFRAGEFSTMGVVAVYGTDPGTEPLLDRLLIVDRADAAVDDERDLAEACEQVLRRARIIRPWRRLRALLSVAPWRSPLAHALSSSEARAYAATYGPDDRAGLRTDLLTTSVLWPALAVLLLAASLVMLRIFDARVAIVMGLATGVVLAQSGAQICAAVVSPLAVGAGSIVLAYAFGLGHAVLLGHFDSSAAVSATAIRDAPFTAVVGGPVGLLAPEWTRGQSSTGVIVVLLGIIAGAISAAGWLMGQPGRARKRSGPDGRAARSEVWRDLTGAAAGAATGTGIGLIYALASLLAGYVSAALAFSVSFIMVGGSTFGVTVAWTSQNVGRGFRFAGAYVVAGALLCVLVFGQDVPSIMLLALSAATGMLHATFFTAAFIVARRRASLRAASLATALEGAVGFVGFVVVRMLQA